MADEMTEFDIKRGYYSKIEGAALGKLMETVFGNVTEKDGVFVSSYGAMARIEAKIISKTQMGLLTVNVDDIRALSDDTILDSKRKLNEFLQTATGFSAKDRMNRAKKKAKEGTL